MAANHQTQVMQGATANRRLRNGQSRALHRATVASRACLRLQAALGANPVLHLAQEDIQAKTTQAKATRDKVIQACRVIRNIRPEGVTGIELTRPATVMDGHIGLNDMNEAYDVSLPAIVSRAGKLSLRYCDRLQKMRFWNPSFSINKRPF
jgi:hypothetical protein